MLKDSAVMRSHFKFGNTFTFAALYLPAPMGHRFPSDEHPSRESLTNERTQSYGKSSKSKSMTKAKKPNPSSEIRKPESYTGGKQCSKTGRLEGQSQNSLISQPPPAL